MLLVLGHVKEWSNIPDMSAAQIKIRMRNQYHVTASKTAFLPPDVNLSFPTE